MNRFRQRPHFVWQLRTRRVPLGECTRLMAIVNVMPQVCFGDSPLIHHDSAANIKLAIATAVQAVDEGADIVDLGTESPKPGNPPRTTLEEQSRLIPVLEGLLHARPEAVVSVEVHFAATARVAARAGAEIVNDVSRTSGSNSNEAWNEAWDADMEESMLEAVAPTGCGLILMHPRRRPRISLAHGIDAASMTHDEIVPEVFGGLCERLAMAEGAGIASARMVLDPGFGIGKRGKENFVLLAGLGRLHELGRPLLIGLSRRRFLGEAVRHVQPNYSTETESRHVATIAANVTAVLGGAHILRVHDLQAAKESAAVADAIIAASTDPTPCS
jgi:dihydropteroate synthase